MRPSEEQMTSQTLVFPLRSNAHSLVRGAPVASVRRKLKTASLLYENVILESGVLSERLIIRWAWPGGGS
jgi:hypothetical protein